MDNQATPSKTITGTYSPQDLTEVVQLNALRAYKKHLEESRREEIKSIRSKLARTLVRARKRQRALLVKELERHKKLHEISVEHKTQAKYSNALLQSKEKIHSLAYQMAQSVLEAECKRTAKPLLQKLRKKLSELAHEPWWKVNVSEDDFSEVSDALSLLKGVSIEINPSLTVGNGSITTPSGTIVIDWEKHLACVFEALVENEEQLCLPPLSSQGE